MPYFSIIVPVYNTSAYLRFCLDSIRMQTFTDWECLCIDDGSSDNSWDILCEYAHVDERFRVFHQGNSGVSKARNKLLDLVEGKYFTFVDSDDVILSDYLEFSNISLEEYACDGLSIQYYSMFSENYEILDINNHFCDELFIYTMTAIEALENKPSRPSIPGNVCCKFYSTSKYGKCRFEEDLFICEDVAYLGNVLSRGGDWCLIEGVSMYCYRQHASSACASSVSFKKTYNALLAVNHVLAYMKIVFPHDNSPFFRYWDIHRKSIEPYYIQPLPVYRLWSSEEKIRFHCLMSRFKKVLGKHLPLYFQTWVFVTPPFAYFDRTLFLFFRVFGKIRKIIMG